MLLLVDTSRRTGHTAALLTPFIDATDMCLELFYSFLGKESWMDVELIREDQLTLKLLKVMIK